MTSGLSERLKKQHKLTGTCLLWNLKNDNSWHHFVFSCGLINFTPGEGAKWPCSLSLQLQWHRKSLVSYQYSSDNQRLTSASSTASRPRGSWIFQQRQLGCSSMDTVTSEQIEQTLVIDQFILNSWEALLSLATLLSMTRDMQPPQPRVHQPPSGQHARQSACATRFSTNIKWK